MMDIIKKCVFSRVLGRRRYSTNCDKGAVVEYRQEVRHMDELRSLSASLRRQRKRLEELVEISGGLDPQHPLQRYSIQRIAWLEAQIEEAKKKA